MSYVNIAKESIANFASGQGIVGTTAQKLSAGINEQQTVAIDNATISGTFTLSFEGVASSAIAHNAAAAAVQTALEGVSTIGAGNVAVTGGPGPSTDWVVTFQGTLKERNVEMLVGDGSLLAGGSTTVTITETIKGRADGAYPVTKQVVVRADGVNAGTISIGPTKDSAATGFVLAGGENSPPIQVDDVNKIFVVGSAIDQNYSWIAS